MNDHEFHRLTQDLLLELPVTLVLNRLLLALRVVVDRTGEAGERALREHVWARKEPDAGDWFSGEPV